MSSSFLLDQFSFCQPPVASEIGIIFPEYLKYIYMTAQHMIRLKRRAAQNVPWQSLVIPNTHLAVNTAGTWVSTSAHWRGVRGCEWLQVMLPCLTTKTLKAYLLAKLIAFPILISQFPVALPSGNKLRYQRLWCCFSSESKPKTDPGATKCPTPKHWSIE